MSAEQSKTLIRGTTVVSILTLLSRFLGFIRDLLTAHLFGAGPIADAYFVAFRIPNLLRSFVAEGALTNAFVPVFAHELEKGKDQAVQTMRAVTTLLLITTTTLTILGIYFSPVIVSLFAPGFSHDPNKQELCVYLTQIMFPLIMCVSIVSMLNGALNSVHIFGSGAWSQVWMNATLILGAFVARFYDQVTGVYLLSWSVVLGGVVQVLVQIPAIKKAGFSLIPARKCLTSATKQIMWLMLPAVLGSTVYQLQIFLNTILASLLPSGSVSWLFYADRLVQLPMGIFTFALGSVLLPMLSRANATENEKEFSSHLINALRYTSFFVLPIAGVLIVFAKPIIGIMFERGAFSAHSTEMTALAVQAYSLGLWAISCCALLARAFIAQRDTLTPTLIGCVTLICTATLSILLMGTPQTLTEGFLYSFVTNIRSIFPWIDGKIALNHTGLALASAISSYVSCCLFILLLSRRKKITWTPFARATIQSLICVLVASGVSEYFLHYSQNYYPTTLIGIPLFCLCFLVSAIVLQVTEMKETYLTVATSVSRRANISLPFV